MALKGKGLLVVLSGPSGCGKDTVLAELKKRDKSICQSVSMTTRQKRSEETDGVDYFFTDVPTFEKNIEKGFFLEYVKYGVNYYGTPKEAVDRLIDDGNTVFLKIEVEGAGNIRLFYPEVVSIFVAPPSFKMLEERLRARGTENEEDLQRRIRIAENELSRAHEYDYVVINDTLPECIDDIFAILRAERLKYKRMSNLISEVKSNAQS